MFVVSRLILGLGIPFAIVAASSLIGELSHPKERARLGSLFNACYFIGSIIAAGVTLGTFGMSSNWGWRIPSLLQISPSILQITFIYFLPESPRWLISKGRGEEAMAILVKYHAEGDVNSEFVKAEYAQIERTLELELETSKTSWKDFASTPGMQKRLLVTAGLGLFTQWSGNGLTSCVIFSACGRKLTGITQISPCTHPRRNRHPRQPLQESHQSCPNRLGSRQRHHSRVNCHQVQTAHDVPGEHDRQLHGHRHTYSSAQTCTISLFLIFTGWTVASAQYVQTGSKPASKAVLALVI